VATNPFLQDPLTKLATELEVEAAQPLPGQQAAAPTQTATEPTPAKTSAPVQAADAAPAPTSAPESEGRRPSKAKSMLPPPQFQPTFDAAAKQYNVPVNVLMALGQQESGYNATIIGQPTKWGRAKGMMQYLDSTAAGLGINPLNPDEAIGAAAKQLRERLDKGYSMEDAVKEHFAGPDRKLWGAKTAAYGREVMQKTAQIGDLLGASTGGQASELQGQLDAEEPGRYKVLPAGYAQNNQSAAMPRDTYLRTFRQNNPNASPAAIEQAMAQYDKTKARAPAMQGITVPDSPEAFFDQRLNQRLQGPANGIVPGLPGVLTRQQQDDADFLNIGTKTNAPTGVAANAADVGKGLKVGLNTAAQDVRELVGRIPVIGQPIVRGGDAVDQFFTGKDSGKLLADDSKAMTESMTPEMQSALKKKWYDSESGKMGPAWSDWRSYTGGLVQSLPEQALTMVPAMRLAKMAYTAKIAAGATAEVAALSAARTAQVAGSLAEGALGGAQSAREVREDVMALPPEVLAQSDAFKSLVASGLSPADAQKALAEDVATRAFVTSGLVTGAFGGMGDRAIAKLFAEKIGKSAVAGALKGFGKGAIAEGLFEELPQSMGQRLSQNEAMQKADPTRALSDDVINQGLGGAVLGGLQGGGMGAVAGARGSRPSPEQEIATEINRQVNEVNFVGGDAAARGAMDPNNEAIDPAATRKPVPPSQTPAAPADSAPPAPPSGKPLTDALNGAAEQPQRVVVDTPGGPVAGTLQAYQEDEQGGFTAQVVDDNGQVVTISDTDGVQITPVAPSAGPLTSAVEQAAEEHADAQPAIEVTAKTLMDSETEKAKSLTDEELRNAVAQQTNSGAAPETAAPSIEAAQAPAAAPEPAAAAEPAVTPIAEMSDADLRKRLKYIAGQAKQSGWDKRFMEARREIEREINQRADGQKKEAAAAASAVAEPTEFADRADANAAMLRAAEREGKVFEVVESGDKFKIQPLAEVNNAGIADGNGRRGSDRAAGGNEPAVGNGSVPAGDAGRRLADVGTADRANEQRDAAGVPAADRAAVADAPLKDAHAGKWFSSQEKADAYVAKKKIGASHEVVKTGKVRFEVKPRAAEPAIPSNSGELESSPVPDLAGKKIDKEWTAFAADSGTLNIDRAEMPQVKAEHRGALVNYLNARGIAHEQAEVAAGDLKPTQREFSPEKVARAKAFDRGDRSILISSDNHVLDGHHQWLAKRDDGGPVKVIRLGAPIKQLLDEVKDFPSAQAAAGATAPVAASAEKVPDLAPAAPAAPVAKPAPKKLTGKAAAAERARQLADYFTPGNIVKGYGGYDRVIAYTPSTKEEGMNVRVQAVEKKDGQWVPVKNERERSHSTIPSEREMKTGVVERAPAAEEVPEVAPQSTEKAVPPAVRDTSGKSYETRGEPLPAKGVAPANIGSNGIAYIGKPNSQHFQIAMDHPTSERGAFLDTGFVTPDGQYLSREEALAWVNENEKAVKPAENMGGQLDALDYRDQVPQSSRKGKGAPAAPAKKAAASKPRKPAATVAQEEAPAAPIADFGEKIEGARKDLWASYKTELKGELPADVKEITLAKHFPEPNYDALIAEGVDVKVLAALKAMRDEIPAKPRVPYKAKRWGEQVTALRSFANDLLDGTYTADTLLTKMRTTDSGALRKFADRIQMYAEVGYPAFRQAKGYNLTSNSYSLFAGKEYKPNIVKFDLTKDGRTVSYFDSWDEAIGALKSLLSAAPAPAASRATKLDMYRLSNGEIVIGKKVAAGKYIDLKGGFKDVRTARDYLRENEAELAKLLEAKKDVRTERRSINTPRVGKDMRLGEDISPEKFGETFGFRGVQFGNYVEQKRRAADLNNAYDALLDMAEITGLPPAAISLDGSLGLAFGARGAGGKNAAAAHYEPGKVVINLTKTNGAGSLGHEWWHALDNYFSRKRGDIEGFVSAKPTVRKKAGEGRTLVDDDSIRPEALEAFNGVVSAIQASGMPKRSSMLDARRTKDYWSTIHELTARAFESYLIDKSAEKGGSNDYLANIVSEDAHKAMDEMTGQPEPFPYPTREEAPAINAAFDKLFEVLKTETTDKGTALFSVAPSEITIAWPDDTEAGENPAAITAAVEARGAEAFITAEDNADGSYSITESGLPSDMQGQGTGVQLYEALLAELFSRGQRVTSDNSVSEKAQKIYQALKRRGYAIEQNADAVIDPETGALEADGPVFTIGPNPSAKSVGKRTGAPLTADTLRAAVTDGALGPVVDSLIDAGLVVLHETPATLPRNVGNQAQDIQAVTTPDGKVHLVASALSAGNARAVMLHEAFHQGGEKLIGTQEWDALMRRAGQLYRQANQSQGKAKEFFDKARERVYSAYRKGAVEPHMEVEEFAAYAIEEYESAPATVRKWIDDLIGMVKAWALKRFGKQLGALTPAQLSALAKMAVLDVAATRRGEVFGKKGDWFSVAGDTRADPAPAPSPTPTPGPAPAPADADLTPPEQGRLRKIQAALQNNMNRLRQVQDRIEKLAGAPMRESVDYYGAETNRPGRVAARLEDAEKKLVNPLMTRLAKSKHTPEQLSELLHAMHAQERNEKIAEFNQNMPDGGSGMTTAEADRILDKYAAARELHAIADQAREIAKATLDLKLAYGLINDEDHKQLTEVYDNYVPLKGDGEFGPKIKRAMGHDAREEHILENLSRDYNQAVIVGEKNLARQSLLRMVLAHLDPALWTVGVPPRGRRIAGQTFLIKSGGETIASFNTLSQATAFAEGKGGNVEITDTKGERIQEYVRPLQDNEVMVYVKGSPVRIQIKDAQLAAQLRPLDQGKMNPILEFMRGTNRYLSKIYTGYNPAFILRNATRDAMTGTISMLGNNGATIAAKAWAKYPGAVKALGVWAATGKTPDGKTGNYLTEYRMHGGKVGASWMSDLEANGKKLSTMYEDAYGATNYAKDGRPTKAAIVAGRKIVGGMAHIVEIANQATENGLRLSLYIAMREKGATPGKAAQAAKTVTVDFDRKGTMTGTLSAIYLFFNPAVQGSANALKTLVKGEHKQQAWAALGSLALLGAYLASRGMDDDKDRWLGEGWETRSKNMIWNVGGHQIRVPVSQEYAPAFSLGMALSEAAHGESKMKASARILSAFLDAYFPLQGAHIDGSDNPAMDLSLAATPTMLKPFAQSAANRSSFGGQVVPENTMTKDRPDNLKMFRGTKNSLYDKAAQNIASFGELTGAGKYENDITKVSPETLKMLWRTYTGGLGTFVTDSMGVTAMTASDPGQVEASDIPIVKDFWRASDVKPIRGRYYDLTGEARGAITEFEQAKKAGDGEAMEKLFDDPAKAQAVSTGRLVKSVNKAAASIRDGEVDINARTDMTPSEKRAALKDLEKQEEELYRSAIEAFK
jgi:ribosomal protein S18 acetylase RimI-like enzyme